MNVSNFTVDNLIKEVIFTFNNSHINGWLMKTYPIEYYNRRSDINPNNIIIGSNTFYDYSALKIVIEPFISKSRDFESL